MCVRAQSMEVLQESSVFGLQLLASSSPPPVPVFFGQRQWSCPMILYDNKSILSLSCKYHGSVFPKAAPRRYKEELDLRSLFACFFRRP